MVTVWRLRSAAVCSLLIALAFAQEPGMTTVDTKVDLAVNPVGWLLRSLHLWNPVANFGEVQNQAYGYLWPMGPFFAIGEALALPAWAVQRLWWGLLLCVAYTGIVALGSRLGIGTPATRMVAGVAFALCPRILTELGPISVEAWPTAVAPWVLVPLIGLAKGQSIRRAVVLSGLAVGCAGGVNATAVFATVPLALLWLVMLQPLRRKLIAIGAWCLAVLAATAWWLVPLLLLSRYSPPFLDYIEVSEVTTRVTDLTSVLRGTNHWLAYLDSSYGPAMNAGFQLIHAPLLFAATVVVAAMGVAGLARRGMPHRVFLITGLLLGVAMVTAGHLSDLDTGFSAPVRAFLDGVGAPLRNVHKFDVLLRIPLALGLAHLVGLFARAATWAGPGWHLARRRVLVVGTAVLAAIATAATPALSGGVTATGSFVAVPGYWRETAAWVNATAGDGRVLVVPAARFPRYQWGNPSDEITQPLLEAQWGVRNSIPLTPANTIRLLDSIESVLASGAGSAGLADVLARSGVEYLLLRNDLNYGSSGSARPAQVRQALSRSPGLSLVRSFGPEFAGGPIGGDFYDYGLGVKVHAIEIFKVERETAPVALYPGSAVQTVIGGPESLLELAAAGRLSAAPSILAGDLGTIAPPGPVVITDGLRRRETAFGRSQDRTSATLTSDEPWSLDVAAHDYLPPWGPDWTTVARYTGVTAITASSSWAQPQPLVGSRPEHLPFAAIDGDPATSWRTAPEAPVQGQWLELTLAKPTRISSINVVFETETDYYPTKVTMLVGPEPITSDVALGKVTVNVPIDVSARRIRIVIPEVMPTLRIGGGGVGIAEIEIEGLAAGRTMVTPRAPEQVTGSADVVLTAAPATGACLFVGDATRCNPGLERGSEDNGIIDRLVELPGSAVYQPELWVRPAPGPDLDRLIDEQITAQNPLSILPTITASSRGVADPAARPAAVLDGNPSTAWYVGHGDGNASLRVNWLSERLITGLRLQLDPNVAATRPDRVTVVSSDGTRGGILDSNGEVRFDSPLRTDEITILLLDPFAPTRSRDPYTNQWQLVPLAVGELTVLPDPPNAPVDLDRIVDLPCGSGPPMLIGDTVVQTAITAPLRALIELREVRASACSGTAGVGVNGGETRIVVNRSAIATPARLALSTGALPAAPAGPMQVSLWTSAERRLTVTAADGLRVLAMRENTNPGWIASIGGLSLAPIVVDGWQQGWFVPAGLGGEVVIKFAPDRPYRLALAGGAALAVGLVGLAFLPAPRAVPPPVRRGRGRRRVRWLPLILATLCLAAVGGVWAFLLVVAAAIALALRPALHRLSHPDRRRAQLVVAWLRLWLAPLFVLAAGLASWRSPERHQDLVPQLLALCAVVALWLSMSTRVTKPRKRLRRPLQQVVAGRGERQPAGEDQAEDGQHVSGEVLQPSVRPVDERQYQRMP